MFCGRIFFASFWRILSPSEHHSLQQQICNDCSCFSGERCLDHDTNMMALRKVNPHADWIVKPHTQYLHFWLLGHIKLFARIIVYFSLIICAEKLLYSCYEKKTIYTHVYLRYNNCILKCKWFSIVLYRRKQCFHWLKILWSIECNTRCKFTLDII